MLRGAVAPRRSNLDSSATAASKRPYHHGDLRRALIEAALQLIAAEGARALTLREVARRAGVTHAAPYRHFPSKDALLAAVAEEGFRGLHNAMLERMERAGADLRNRFLESGVGYVLFAVQHPAHFRVMFGSELPASASYPELAAVGHAAFAVLTDAIAACQQAGLVRADPVPELALAAWTQVHGLAMLLIDRQLEPYGGATRAEELAYTVAHLLNSGLAPGAAPL
jgi:AcrR family transcriptional regulator